MTRADSPSEEDRRLIVTVRERLRYIDGLSPSDRHAAIYGSDPTGWVAETMGLMDGSLIRRWHPNPDYMKPGEPVGYWATERKTR